MGNRKPSTKRHGFWIVAEEILDPDVKQLKRVSSEEEALAWATTHMASRPGHKVRKHLWAIHTKVGEPKRQLTIKFYPEED